MLAPTVGATGATTNAGTFFPEIATRNFTTSYMSFAPIITSTGICVPSELMTTARCAPLNKL